MAKISQHFTITKKLPIPHGSIEFSGIVYKRDASNYDIEDVIYHTVSNGQPVTESITQWFHTFRACTDPFFHDDDIQALLNEWLTANPIVSHIKVAA